MKKAAFFLLAARLYATIESVLSLVGNLLVPDPIAADVDDSSVVKS